MIIWGGYNGTNYLNDGARFSPASNSWIGWIAGSAIGARYNPASDSWTPVTTSGAPAGRYLHTAVWTGSEMIVWGGANGSGYYNDTFIYRPARALYLYQRL
jgi:hypothetical protein